MTQEIFGGQAETTPEQTPQVTSNQQTPEKLDARLAEKDNFIAQLKNENAQMREVVKQFDPLKLELQSLKAELSTLKGAGQPMAAVSQDDIKSLVQGAIKEAETERSASQNIKKATDDFAALFAGDYAKAAEAVQAKAAKLGLSPEWLRGVAAKSPSAFLRLMTDTEVPAASAENGSQPFVQGTVNAQALAQNQNVGVLKPGSKAYYDDMMKKNPSKYFTPKMQLELMDAARKGTYWG